MKPNFTTLLVDDDENDVLLFKKAMAMNGLKNPVQVAKDGEEAIAYLLRKPPYDEMPDYIYPEVIITDIKMPKKSGLEFLQWLKDNPVYRVIPTMVMSSSNNPQEVKQAYYLGAAAFMQKPKSLEELRAVLNRLYQFWCDCEIPE
jgi:CheY-like chemotaxis protein